MSGTSKIRSRQAAVAWRGAVKGPVVFTNGVFDLLHVGHIEVLEAARREGAALVVGVNSDRSARDLGKESARPFVDQNDRARIVAALAAVDVVVLFDEPTPLALIQALQPDVLVKGGDYSADTIVGADLVRARGGRVVLVPLVPNRSSTHLVARVRGSA